MEQWIQQTLSADRFGHAVYAAAFLLGILGAVSSCCTVPAASAVAGYAGAFTGRFARRDIWIVGSFFLLGTVLSLAAVGTVASLAGEVAGAALGRYWRLIAGLGMVVFGLAGSGLLPLRMPGIGASDHNVKRGTASAILYGLAVGGGTTACSVTCNPLLLVAVGAAVVQGAPGAGAAMLACFALGYGLPVTGFLLGLSFGAGRIPVAFQRVVRVGVGWAMVAAGFFLLATA